MGWQAGTQHVQHTMPCCDSPRPCCCSVATDNFVEDVHGGFQCEVQKPYVLYRNRANEVRWQLGHCQRAGIGGRAEVG